VSKRCFDSIRFYSSNNKSNRAFRFLSNIADTVFNVFVLLLYRHVIEIEVDEVVLFEARFDSHIRYNNVTPSAFHFISISIAVYILVYIYIYIS
jgi:hypothetical protein